MAIENANAVGDVAVGPINPLFFGAVFAHNILHRKSAVRRWPQAGYELFWKNNFHPRPERVE